MWSDCQNFSDEKLESPPVTITINDTRLVHISHQSTKGSLFFNIQTDSLEGQNESICNESASKYLFCQRLNYFLLNEDGTSTPKPNMTPEMAKTVNISKARITTTVMTLPLSCKLSNGTAIGELLHYLHDKRGTFTTSSKEMSGQSTHSYSSVNASGNGSTECTSQYIDMCGVCVPKCSSFHSDLQLTTNSDETIEEILLMAACVVAILGEIVFIVLALIRRNEMYVSNPNHYHKFLQFMILHYLMHSTHFTVTVSFAIVYACTTPSFLIRFSFHIYCVIPKVKTFGNNPLYMMCFGFWSLT